jgi:hypothetical protein
MPEYLRTSGSNRPSASHPIQLHRRCIPLHVVRTVSAALCATSHGQPRSRIVRVTLLARRPEHRCGARQAMADPSGHNPCDLGKADLLVAIPATRCLSMLTGDLILPPLTA